MRSRRGRPLFAPSTGAKAPSFGPQGAWDGPRGSGNRSPAAGALEPGYDLNLESASARALKPPALAVDSFR
jgi:hypothetical protein